MSNERKFKLQVTEEELLALISYHSNAINQMSYSETPPNPDHTARLHDLVKRLNRKDEPEIEEVQIDKASPSVEHQPKSEW